MRNEVFINPAYLAALDVFRDNIEKFKKMMNNSSLSVLEKKLLACHLKIRKNNNNEVLEVLKSIKTENIFLQAQINLLNGLAHNNMGNPKLALNEFEESISCYELFKENNQIFFPVFNLILALENLGDLKGIKSLVNRLKKVDITTPIMHINLLRVISSAHCIEKEYKKALKALDEAFEHTEGSMEHYQSFLFVDKFILLFKMGHYSECELLIKEYNHIRIFRSSSNYNFMKILLDHFIHNSPIYLKHNDFQDSPFLEAQIQVIRNLSRLEVEDARFWWNKLRDMNPRLYLDNFHYDGSSSLFSECLKKHQAVMTHSNQQGSIEVNLDHLSIQEKLIYVLKNGQAPMSRTELISLLWKDEPYSISMENRLDALIYRVKKNHKLKILKINSYYKLAS
jgi:tetratricopeptide (TPR) repeat protein